MIMKNNKQIGFIYKNNESIDKIIKNGDVVFEKGFLREKISTTFPITFGGVGKNLKDYKVYGNTVQSKLPDGYTQVDYIESSGTQYIDTNYTPTQNDNFELKNVSTPNISGTLFSAGTGDYQLILHNNRYFKYFASGAAVDIGNNVIFNNSNIKIEEGSLYVDNVLKGVSTYGGKVNTTLQLFRRANGGNYKTCSIGEVIITNKNTLVRDFIPCYRNSDNEVGLYDLVNNVFYTNQGTGVFTYGSVAPTPNAPIEIISCGDRTKNLFDKNNANIINAYISAGNKIASSSVDRIIYISCKPNTTYSLQKILQQTTSKNRFRVGTTSTIPQNNDTVYDCYKYNDGTTVINHTITTGSTAKYLIFYCYSIDELTDFNEMLDSIQIEESSSATSYEPYGYKIPVNVNNTITNIYLNEPLRKSSDGAYIDYIDFKNGKVYRQIKEITLTGSESWGRVGANNNGNRFRTAISDLAIGAEKILHCTHFKNDGDTWSHQGISGSSGTMLYIRWDELFETVVDLTTWLASNTPIVDYVLATPTEETITLPNIPTIDGNNTLNIDTEITPSQVYIKYKSNT